MKRLLKLPALLVLVLCVLPSSSGCRICLPAHTQSNLWARAVEDRADWHLAQAGKGINSAHREKCMSDWTKGFYRGYQNGAFHVNGFCASNYPAVWSSARRDHCEDEAQVLAGYNAGYQQAVHDGPINVALKR